MKETRTIVRFRGALLGLAAGDALGTTLEFQEPGSFEPIDNMTGGGPFRLAPGQWTDDTSMTLCLAESLVEQGGFDPVDQLERYLKWCQEGYLSSTGSCFDIGGTVRTALMKFKFEREPFSGPTHEKSAGNGSIMRLAPVPLFYAADPLRAVEMSGESSRTTHGTRACIDACRYFGGLIAGAVNGAGKEELLSAHYGPDPGYWEKHPLCPAIDEIAAGSFKEKEPPAIIGSGYVIKSLEAALWAFYKTETFKEGALLAVNLGNDADTTGAVYGQLAGACYGLEAIPEEWCRKIAFLDLILDLAEHLYSLSGVEGSVFKEKN